MRLNLSVEPRSHVQLDEGHSCAAAWYVPALLSMVRNWLPIWSQELQDLIERITYRPTVSHLFNVKR